MWEKLHIPIFYLIFMSGKFIVLHILVFLSDFALECRLYLFCMMSIATLFTEFYLTLDTQHDRAHGLPSEPTYPTVPFCLCLSNHVLQTRDKETVWEPVHTILRDVYLPSTRKMRCTCILFYSILLHETNLGNIL